MEMVWSASASLGASEDIFCVVNPQGYGPPSGAEHEFSICGDAFAFSCVGVVVDCPHRMNLDYKKIFM